jgi:hypothetical protein
VWLRSSAGMNVSEARKKTLPWERTLHGPIIVMRLPSLSVKRFYKESLMRSGL